MYFLNGCVLAACALSIQYLPDNAWLIVTVDPLWIHY